MPAIQHNYYFGLPRGFVVFNDQALSMEPIAGGDVEIIAARDDDPAIALCASAAWSAGCDWYFVVTDDSILLLNVAGGKGLRCSKKSAMFIDVFLSSRLPQIKTKQPRKETDHAA